MDVGGAKTWRGLPDEDVIGFSVVVGCWSLDGGTVGPWSSVSVLLDNSAGVDSDSWLTSISDVFGCESFAAISVEATWDSSGSMVDISAAWKYSSIWPMASSSGVSDVRKLSLINTFPLLKPS